MGTKVKETCTVLSQECIGKDIYSMWIQTKTIAGNAKPGQFVSVYTQDGSKLLPRPISLCEIDKEKGALRLVYRVTGPKTGTESFSRLHAGAQLELLGPLGNGFPLEEAAAERVMRVPAATVSLFRRFKRRNSVAVVPKRLASVGSVSPRCTTCV